jgi:dUTPase
MEEKVILVENIHGNTELPAKANDYAAGYDVHPIEVKMIAHNGYSVTCTTNEQIINECIKLRKKDKRSWWKRFKDWLNDEQPLKGWKQIRLNTGLKLQPLDPDLYISLEPCSRTIKTDYSMHNSLGTIDNDYRGYCWAIYNANHTTYDSTSIIILFNTCCQLKGKISVPLNFRLSETLTETERGEGGFGSTMKSRQN